MNKLVCFDVAAPFGFFKKFFTTTNALTYAVIPRSGVEGLVGSILGLSRADFPDMLKESKIAVQLLSPVRKMNMKYMHINKDWWYQSLSNYIYNKGLVLEERKQMSVPTSVEMLVSPSYRLYIDTTNEQINEDLAQNLKDKQCYYTPFLGVSSCICSTKYVGEFEYKEHDSKDFVYVSSIFSYDVKMPLVKLEKGIQFASEEDLIIHISNERKQEGTYKVLYTPKPSKILIEDGNLAGVQTGDEKVYVKFLPLKV